MNMAWREMDIVTSGVDNLSLDRRLRLEEAQSFAERFMAHETLLEVSLPAKVSKFQLLLGSIILFKGGVAGLARDRILAAMLLVYHGLALHEDVAEDSANQSRRGRLTILGGDYYSSLFYRLLAEAGRVDLVSRFSEAVVKINIAKTSLHESRDDGSYRPEHYICDVMIVQGALLQALRAAFAPDAATAALLDAALRAGVYDDELCKLNRPEVLTLANVLLGAVATPDERRQINHVGSFVSILAGEKRIASLHAKYGTPGRLFQGFRDAAGRLQALSTEMFGLDGWMQLSALFETATGAGPNQAPVVEGS